MQIGENAPHIREKTSLDRLFVHLDATVWNFIDYALLEHIIKLYCSHELKEEMQKYATNLLAFKKKTTISELIRFWPGRKEVSPTYCDVVAKIDLDPEKVTLYELDEIRKELSGHFLPPLSEYALIHFKVRSGSIWVRWVIASDLIPVLTNSICKPNVADFFCEHSIQCIHIRGIQVYPISINRRPSGDPFQGI